MPESLPSDTTRCPLCGQANVCAAEAERITGVPQEPCWCLSVPFDDALLSRLPPQSVGVACICARCAAG